MNKEEFIDNFSIDLTNTTVAERKKYAEKIFNKIDSLQQQVFNKTLEIKGIEEVLKAKEQECEELKEIINKSAKNFCNDYLETFEENQKLKEDLQNLQHNCTREGCRYYEDNTYKVFYKCKAKAELSKCQKALDEIEYQTKELFLGVENKDRPYCEKILDIINKGR